MMEHPAFFKVVARAWSDAAYKAELLSDPVSALAKMGLSAPAGVALEVHENTASKMHLVLPVAPPNVEVDEREWDAWTS
jgi:hypothetical protein